MYYAMQNCKICENKVSHYLTIKNYHFVRCTVCGLVFVDNISQNELNTFYEKDYFDGKLARFSASGLEEVLPVEKEWLIKKYIDNDQIKSILEIGPGISGGMIKYFRNDSKKIIECVEISQYATDYLNQNGIRTFKGKIYQYKPIRKYDAVIATEVIEHEINPSRFVKTVADILNANGLFLCTTGNIESLIARLNGESWYYIDPPAHICYFNPHNLRLLLLNNGFSKIEVNNIGFRWIRLFLRYKMLWLLPFISRLHIATGMLIIARK